jgi:hypothetical protein
MNRKREWGFGLGVLAVAVILGCGPGTGAVLLGVVASPGDDGDDADRLPPIGRPEGVEVHLGSSELTVEWLPVKGASSYNIYWGSAPGVTPATGEVIPEATSPYLHTGLVNGQTYYYVVSALKGTRLGPMSGEVASIPVSPPANVLALAGDSQVTLTWTETPGIWTYAIYWDTSPGVTCETGICISGVNSGYVHTNLTNGTTYYYCVTALTPYGESGESAEVFAIPAITGASVVIDGTPITFTGLRHYYDAGWDESVVELTGSSPAGWEVQLVWMGNSNPGCPVDSCFDAFYAIVISPSWAFYIPNWCTNDVVMCVTQFAASPGGTTAGTFSGELENWDPPYDVITLTSGQFAVLRQ